MSRDVEKMTNDEFIEYREDLLKKYLAKGFVLTPNADCDMCDVHDGYTCFQDEIFQLQQEGIE
jgi:hypothetical protein